VTKEFDIFFKSFRRETEIIIVHRGTFSGHQRCPERKNSKAPIRGFTNWMSEIDDMATLIWSHLVLNPFRIHPTELHSQSGSATRFIVGSVIDA
jgi:hypothetical protein